MRYATATTHAVSPRDLEQVAHMDIMKHWSSLRMRAKDQVLDLRCDIAGLCAFSASGGLRVSLIRSVEQKAPLSYSRLYSRFTLRPNLGDHKGRPDDITWTMRLPLSKSVHALQRNVEF